MLRTKIKWLLGSGHSSPRLAASPQATRSSFSRASRFGSPTGASQILLARSTKHPGKRTIRPHSLAILARQGVTVLGDGTKQAPSCPTIQIQTRPTIYNYTCKEIVYQYHTHTLPEKKLSEV